MKKIFLFLFALFVLLLPVVALAEGELPTEPFTWVYLATLGGATVAVMLIVQFCKFPLDKVWKIPTRLLVYVISLVILLLATYFTSGLTVESGILTVFNAFIVALAAMGLYEVTPFSKNDRELAALEFHDEE